MANNVSIICATPPTNSVEPQPVKKEPAISDGICRADPNAPAVDLSDLGINVRNSTSNLITNPVAAALTTPTATNPRTRPRVGPTIEAAAALSARTERAFTFGADPAPRAHAPAAFAEPAMAVESAGVKDVVVDQTATIIPQDTVTPAEQRALATAKALPTSSGDAILTPNKEGLITGMEAVLRANPDLVANAAAKGVNREELRIILANSLWGTAISSDGGRFAVPLRTYPGAYAAILDEHLRLKAEGDQHGAGKALATGEGVVTTAINQLTADGRMTGPEAYRHFWGQYVQGRNDDSAYVRSPAVRAQLADPTVADRMRPWSEMSSDEKRTAANTVQRGYRSAAAYDPADDEPLYADDVGADVAMSESGTTGGMYAEVHQAARENARRQERQATANRDRTRAVNLQNDRDQGVRLARRRDMDLFAYRGRVVPGTMTAALRDPFRRTL